MAKSTAPIDRTDTKLSDAQQLTQLIEALRAQPDLLMRHPELLSELELPVPGDSVSLQQFQLRRLRADNQALTQQLQHLSRIAAQNEQLMRRLHQMTLSIMAVTDPDEVAEQLTDNLKQDFQADAVCLHRLCPNLPDWINQCLSDGQVRCGRFTQAKLKQVFPDSDPQPRSAALVPIEGIGLLAIGADDEQRFQPDMGSLFLELLAITVQHRLAPDSQR
jgi:uncharacterized protein YigA (DUF484 family)